MKKIPFVKYTSYGNNFVIIDETNSPVMPEEDKSSFAHMATDTCFGIGCDNLLIVQRCTERQLGEINRVREYWSEIPGHEDVDFIFRMFEPNGDEAFSCGNGLMSVANYLYRTYEIESTRVMTELPFAQPKIIQIGFDAIEGRSWANLGHPRRVPEHVAAAAIRRPFDECIDLVDRIRIRFRSFDLKAYTEDRTLQMCGYLIFTGEPHLVIFPHDSFSEPELAGPIFARPSQSAGSRVRRRISMGSWLLRRIGMFLNDNFRSQFPAGINLSFAQVIDHDRVEYRCFERGINRETLSCGTGAMAVAVVSRHRDLVPGSKVQVVPHLCRNYRRDPSILVERCERGNWHLVGAPRLLMEGKFAMASPDEDEGWDPGEAGPDTLDTMSMDGEYGLGSTIPPTR